MSDFHGTEIIPLGMFVILEKSLENDVPIFVTC
jgi:hypothetical protein